MNTVSNTTDRVTSSLKNDIIGIYRALWVNHGEITDGIDLFNKSDDDIIDIFLGKSWGKLEEGVCRYLLLVNM